MLRHRRHVSRALHQLTRNQSTSATQWSPPPRGSAVFVAMSGGVDSSVTAKLLLEDGYEVKPVFMRNWDTLDEQSSSGGCEWERDFAAVERVCRESLGGIQPRLVDLSKQYWNSVFQQALDAWQAGTTPNPDVACNQLIKFRELPARLLELDSNAWLATGHYARLLPSTVDSGLPALHRGAFLAKDQSYYLSTSPLSALSRTMFPIGGMTKTQVRELAHKWKLHTADKKESMGICFVGQRDRFGSWLETYLRPNPGDIVDETGRVVGKHQGLWQYTIGEGARLSGFPQRMFVGQKDFERNVVVVVPKSHPLLQCTQITTRDFIWSSPSYPPPAVDEPEGLQVTVQTRSVQAGSLARCTVRRLHNGSFEVNLHGPITGVAPGQAVVLYDDTWCLGGGTIHATRTMAYHVSNIIDE